MPPGGAAIRSATSRWSISTNRSGRGSASRTRCSTGLVMWYGRLATRSHGASTRSSRSHVQDVALDQAQRRDTREPLAQVLGQAGGPPPRR